MSPLLNAIVKVDGWATPTGPMYTYDLALGVTMVTFAVIAVALLATVLPSSPRVLIGIPTGEAGLSVAGPPMRPLPVRVSNIRKGLIGWKVDVIRVTTMPACLAVMEVATVSVAVTDWVPAVSSVTLKTWRPEEMAASTGRTAAPSELVRWTVPT